jgi:hypothetical protein
MPFEFSVTSLPSHKFAEARRLLWEGLVESGLAGSKVEAVQAARDFAEKSTIPWIVAFAYDNRPAE